MADYYMLDEQKQAVPFDVRPNGVLDTVLLAQWGRMFENNEARRVAATEVGDARVSTVFLGMDHAFGGGPP